MNKPLHVLALYDGRPGHEKQTHGVLEALAALTSLEVSSERLGPPSVARRLRHTLIYVGGLLGFDRRIKPPEPVDLLIGTGASTHLPLVVLRRRCCAKAVTCMTPDPPYQHFLDLCFIPQHDQPSRADNVFETVGPPCPAMVDRKHNPQQGLILVGGVDVKSHRWDSEAVMQQIGEITQRMSDKRWTISSSPRTPDDMLKFLRRFAAQTSGVDFYTCEETPQGWIEEAYGRHATVWVTADSVSMVYEALSAGCGVGILPVAWKKAQNKFQLGLENLYQQKLVVAYNDWLSGQPLEPADRPLNEAQRCAKEILRRWWPDRLT